MTYIFCLGINANHAIHCGVKIGCVSKTGQPMVLYHVIYLLYQPTCHSNDCFHNINKSLFSMKGGSVDDEERMVRVLPIAVEEERGS